MPVNNQLVFLLIVKDQKFTSSVANLSASARGLDTKECDDVITTILQSLHNVLLLEDTPTGDYPSTADELASATKALGAAMTQAMNTAKNNPKSLGPASKLVGSTTISLIDSAKKTATLSPDHGLQVQILHNTKEILQRTADSLNYAISAAADPSNTGKITVCIHKLLIFFIKIA
jgi:hypothetical protein